MKIESMLVALVVASSLGCHSKPEESKEHAPAPPPSVPMNVTPLPAASIASVMNPAHLPPYTGPTGSIEGTVRVDGPASPDVKNLDFSSCPGAARMYGKLFREGAPGADGARPLADAIVAVTGYSGYYLPERNESETLKIQNCAFEARTVAMTFGQRLDVANEDPDLWAPSLVQAPMPALMMATSHGDPVRIYPPHPGYFTLVDKNHHDAAQVDVYALLHPLHAVSSAAGHYRIDGVPVGKLKVGARLRVLQHEAAADVEILANVVQNVDLLIHYVPTVERRSADGGLPPRPIP